MAAVTEGAALRRRLIRGPPLFGAALCPPQNQLWDGCNKSDCGQLCCNNTLTRPTSWNKNGPNYVSLEGEGPTTRSTVGQTATKGFAFQISHPFSLTSAGNIALFAGLSLAVVGIYGYTIYEMKTDDFADIDEKGNKV